MEAVKEARAAFAPVLKEWAGTIPTQLADLQSIERLAEEAQSMYSAGYALGMDPGAEVVATLGGSISGGTRSLRATRGTKSTRSRSRTRTRSTANGHGPTAEQVLTWMQGLGRPVSQSEAATHFGVTRQTIAKRFTSLRGQITITGGGASKRWRAKELIPA